MIVVTPVPIPVAKPALSILATKVSAMVQVPPDTLSVNRLAVPRQTLGVPEIAVGWVLTVMTAKALQPVDKA